MSEAKYTCPVCEYPNLEEPPKDYSICPSCGVEFENDDYGQSHADIRERWIKAGRPVWRAMARNRDWNDWYQRTVLHPRMCY